MNPEWRKYAPVGLIVALVAALGTAGLYFVRREFDIYIQVGIALVVLGIAAFAALDPDKVRTALSGRQARYGSNALVFLLAALGILVVINYLAFSNPKRWDLTEDKSNTLAPETLEVLGALEAPVLIQAFYTSPAPEPTVQLFENYKVYSDDKVTYEFINPLLDPVAAQKAEVAQDRTIVLWMDERREVAMYASEQEMTGALIRLMSGEKRAVYFLTGHGEYSPDDTGDESYALVKRVLVGKNYKVETMSLLGGSSIPEDASVIVIAGPIVPVTAEEVAEIKEFVDGGGSLFVMEEPLLFTQYTSTDDPLAEYLAEDWGVTLGLDVIIDRNSSLASVPFANDMAGHPITNQMPGNILPFFPTARSVTVSSEIETVSAQELVFTAPFDVTWAETDLQGILNDEPIVADEATDILGPVPLMVVAENLETGSRLVVIGDSDFTSDGFFEQQSNGQLFINTMDWIAEQEALIQLSSQPAVSRFVIPPQVTTLYLLYLLTLCIIPGALVVTGGVVWWWRRKRG